MAGITGWTRNVVSPKIVLGRFWNCVEERIGRGQKNAQDADAFPAISNALHPGSWSWLRVISRTVKGTVQHRPPDDTLGSRRHLTIIFFFSRTTYQKDHRSVRHTRCRRRLWRAAVDTVTEDALQSAWREVEYRLDVLRARPSTSKFTNAPEWSRTKRVTVVRRFFPKRFFPKTVDSNCDSQKIQWFPKSFFPMTRPKMEKNWWLEFSLGKLFFLRNQFTCWDKKCRESELVGKKQFREKCLPTEEKLHCYVKRLYCDVRSPCVL